MRRNSTGCQASTQQLATTPRCCSTLPSRRSGGNVTDKVKFRKAIADTQFDAVRGRFRFNTNHIPLSDFYLTTASKDEKGRYILALGEKILSDHKDAYADQCQYPPN